MDYRKSDKTSLWIGIMVWAVFVLLFFAPAVFGGKVLAPMDCLECVFRPFAVKPIEEVHNQYNVDGASQYLPYSWAMQKSWEQDGYMGWNPYTHNGTALPENTMLSPGDWHHWLFGFLPFWTAWDIGILIQFFIAGLGMIILLRFEKLPLLYALLGAIGFSFYSQFIMWMYDRWLGGMIWGPWIVWSFLRKKGKEGVVNIPAVIFISLGFRGGHLQTCTFVFLLVACLFLADWWSREKRWTWKSILSSACPYFVSGVLAALLSLDVFVDTLPRMEGCKPLEFTWGFNRLPTLIASIVPTILGTPQTISVCKSIGADLFDIKFGGGVLFVLALIGLFNRRAPMAAKFCFVISLMAACSPLASFLYSRSTVVMALGMAWLSAWQLYDLSQNPPRPWWRKVAWWGVSLLLLWLFASIVIYFYQEPLLEKLKAIVDGSINSTHQEGRRFWYYLRLERLVSQYMIWNWINIVSLVLIGTGLWACSRLNSCCKRPGLWVGMVVLCTFGEQMLFSSFWLAYGEKPVGNVLYPEPDWMPELRRNVGEGSVSIIDPSSDLDFLCTNHLSSYGIRLAGGYETVQPKYLKPLGNDLDPEDCALAGISHLLYNAKAGYPLIDKWNVVQQTKDFFLLANPKYAGRYFIQTGKSLVSISPEWRTANRMYFTIPPETRSLVVLESFSKGWSARMDDGEVLPVEKTERYGMQINLPYLTKSEGLLLQYHSPYRIWYYSIMSCVAIFLLVTFFLQRRKTEEGMG